MTVAQLVHPMRGLAQNSGQSPFHMFRQAALRWWSTSCNAMLWRAIGIGLGFALIGLTMMVLAIGAAGVVPPASEALADASVVAVHPMPNQRLPIYQEPAERLTGAMPVP